MRSMLIVIFVSLSTPALGVTITFDALQREVSASAVAWSGDLGDSPPPDTQTASALNFEGFSSDLLAHDTDPVGASATATATHTSGYNLRGTTGFDVAADYELFGDVDSTSNADDFARADAMTDLLLTFTIDDSLAYEVSRSAALTDILSFNNGPLFSPIVYLENDLGDLIFSIGHDENGDPLQCDGFECNANNFPPRVAKGTIGPGTYTLRIGARFMFDQATGNGQHWRGRGEMSVHAVFDDAMLVPEPSTGFLLGCGLVALGAGWRHPRVATRLIRRSRSAR